MASFQHRSFVRHGMQKLRDAWREIIHDFGWPAFAVLLFYSALSVTIATSKNLNIYLVPDTVTSLIRTAFWLTVIAITVPASREPLPVKRPLPELLFLIGSIVLDYLAAAHLWNLRATESPYSDLFLYLIVASYLVLAIFFARIFRYSATDLGIPLKHWRLYLGLIILGLAVSIHFLQGSNFAMLIGALSLIFLCALYFTNTKRWQGLVKDLKSFRPYVISILLCSLVTILIQWARYSSVSSIWDYWSIPFRTFQTPTIVKGAMPEEFYYRLGLQSRLLSFMPFGWASLIQGVAFKALHIPQMLAHGSTWSDVLYGFTPGIANAIAAGYFWHRSKNLPATIIFHMAVLI